MEIIVSPAAMVLRSMNQPRKAHSMTTTHESVENATSKMAHRSAYQNGQSRPRMAKRMGVVLPR